MKKILKQALELIEKREKTIWRKKEVENRFHYLKSIYSPKNNFLTVSGKIGDFKQEFDSSFWTDKNAEGFIVKYKKQLLSRIYKSWQVKLKKEGFDIFGTFPRKSIEVYKKWQKATQMLYHLYSGACKEDPTSSTLEVNKDTIEGVLNIINKGIKESHTLT